MSQRHFHEIDSRSEDGVVSHGVIIVLDGKCLLSYPRGKVDYTTTGSSIPKDKRILIIENDHRKKTKQK